MSLTPKSRIYRVRGITSAQEQAIRDYLQGAVRTWCAAGKKGRQFAARDLVGGINYDWRKTPLDALYQKHIQKGKNHQDAVKAAGRDLGWLLKAVLNEDDRMFKVGDAGRAKGYTWI